MLLGKEKMLSFVLVFLLLRTAYAPVGATYVSKERETERGSVAESQVIEEGEQLSSQVRDISTASSGLEGPICPNEPLQSLIEPAGKQDHETLQLLEDNIARGYIAGAGCALKRPNGGNACQCSMPWFRECRRSSYFGATDARIRKMGYCRVRLWVFAWPLIGLLLLVFAVHRWLVLPTFEAQQKIIRSRLRAGGATASNLTSSMMSPEDDEYYATSSEEEITDLQHAAHIFGSARMSSSAYGTLAHAAKDGVHRGLADATSSPGSSSPAPSGGLNSPPATGVDQQQEEDPIARLKAENLLVKRSNSREEDWNKQFVVPAGSPINGASDQRSINFDVDGGSGGGGERIRTRPGTTPPGEQAYYAVGTGVKLYYNDQSSRTSNEAMNLTQSDISLSESDLTPSLSPFPGAGAEQFPAPAGEVSR
ncbi:unnamed protein product [Amoebophrya sp. A120]|nr:unnamed protein product [Amoebophrya sp. A120]|eukprot:GSA120T00005060001.1